MENSEIKDKVLKSCYIQVHFSQEKDDTIVSILLSSDQKNITIDELKCFVKYYFRQFHENMSWLISNLEKTEVGETSIFGIETKDTIISLTNHRRYQLYFSLLKKIRKKILNLDFLDFDIDCDLVEIQLGSSRINYNEKIKDFINRKHKKYNLLSIKPADLDGIDLDKINCIRPKDRYFTDFAKFLLTSHTLYYRIDSHMLGSSETNKEKEAILYKSGSLLQTAFNKKCQECRYNLFLVVVYCIGDDLLQNCQCLSKIARKIDWQNR